MSESQVLSVIKVWAAVAWADGVLALAEAEGLRRLIRGAELTDDERVAAMDLLESPVTLADTDLADLTAEARRGVYRAACRMAVVDHLFSETERALLERLRGVLAVPADIALEIESDIAGLTSSPADSATS